ncbi:ThiF family adenylyltransferase [Streptomyces physcomitrii]|uniref:ThiF family adenylyltransferase n=1 Tax=Streptomyces physcomitrii TaxID=2724184 RepID=UPI0033E36EB0
MHPLLKPSLRPGWHDLNTVQFGVAPAHAVVLSPVDTASGSFLSLLDGTRGLPLLREEAARMGMDEGYVDRLVARLAGAGLIDDAQPADPRARALRRRPAALRRLGPDLASLSVTQRDPDAPLLRLTARRDMRVQVRGAGRVGAVLASVLSAAGVGQVDVMDGGCVEPGDVSPGGVAEAQVGRRRSDAARQAVRRAAADRPRRTRAAHRDGTEPPLSLVVLAPRDGLRAYFPDEAEAEQFLTTGTPHLYAGVLEATGFAGPLVLPGSTPCAGCVLRHRTDRDPRWPRLLAQWHSGGRRRAQACDLALATTVAGLAAARALAFLDGHAPDSPGVRWETSLPALNWHARQLWAHPACPCGAGSEAPAEGMGEHTSKQAPLHATMAG